VSNQPEYDPKTVYGDEGVTVEADGKHVDMVEAGQALSPEVGQGTPKTAPEIQVDEDDRDVTDWSPTKKWWAQLTGTIATILGSWLVTGSFDDVERGMAATALVGLTASYWKDNG
jgi:hypothetical protein